MTQYVITEEHLSGATCFTRIYGEPCFYDKLFSAQKEMIELIVQNKNKGGLHIQYSIKKTSELERLWVRGISNKEKCVMDSTLILDFYKTKDEAINSVENKRNEFVTEIFVDYLEPVNGDLTIFYYRDNINNINYTATELTI